MLIAREIVANERTIERHPGELRGLMNLTSASPPHSPRSGTIRAQILALLSDGIQRSAPEIMKNIPGLNTASVHTALSKMVYRGEICRVQHGVYVLETDPGTNGARAHD